jgi:hypothetical protein
VYTGYRKNIVVLILTLGCGVLYGQQSGFQSNTKSFTLLKGNPVTLSRFYASLNKTQIAALGSIPRLVPEPGQAKPGVVAIQKDLYIKGVGFFCKKEMQIEKSVRLPLRFRLGSLEQCNILEQKY